MKRSLVLATLLASGFVLGAAAQTPPAETEHPPRRAGRGPQRRTSRATRPPEREPGTIRVVKILADPASAAPPATFICNAEKI